MTEDEIIDKILQQITYEGAMFSKLYKRLIDQNENDNKIDAIRLKMESIGLIKLVDGQESWKGDAVILQLLGEEVKKSNGWLIYKKSHLDESKSSHASIVNLHIGDSGNVQKNYGTIGESMNQLSDDFSRKYEIKKMTSQPKANPSKKISKYEIWTLILAGLSILVTIILKLLDYI